MAPMDDAPLGSPAEHPGRTADDVADDAQAERDARGRFQQGNAHRWLPGTSANPHGRPKGLSRLLREIGEAPFPQDPEKVEIDKRILQALAAKAARDNVSAIREWCDRRWGRVPIAIRGAQDEAGDAPVAIEITVVGREDVDVTARSMSALPATTEEDEDE